MLDSHTHLLAGQQSVQIHHEGRLQVRVQEFQEQSRQGCRMLLCSGGQVGSDLCRRSSWAFQGYRTRLLPERVTATMLGVHAHTRRVPCQYEYWEESRRCPGWSAT